MNSKSIPRRVVVIGIAVLAVTLASASSALAEPKGIFNVFKDCPVEASGNALCTYAETTSGEFTIGTSKVPINKTLVLQTGAVSTGGANPNEYFLTPAKDGNTLSKTALNVPGGLAGLINCEEIKGSGLLEVLERGTCKTAFENGVTGVTATTELVANKSNPIVLNLATLFLEEGTALTLPLRVHLKNPLLGESCYIGSEASPIELHLTTGATSPPPPNTSIHGKVGTVLEEEEKGVSLVVDTENTLVDNAFSAPAAEGCGGLAAILLDPIIDVKIGLPSASGHNTAILNGTLRTATEESVLASEKF